MTTTTRAGERAETLAMEEISVEDYKREVKKIRQTIDILPLDPRAAKFERDFLTEMNVGAFYAGTVFKLTGEDGRCLSLNATKFQGSPRKNGWGRYLNCFHAYTPVEQRRKGYAKELLRRVEAEGRRRDCQRLKSLIANWYGFCLHRSRGHQIWGIDPERGQLAVDTPLEGEKNFPDGVPVQVRKNCQTGRALNDQELFAALTGGIYRVNGAVVEARLANSPRKET